MSTQQLCDYAKANPYELSKQNIDIILPIVRSFVFAIVFLCKTFGDIFTNICVVAFNHKFMQTFVFCKFCFIYVRFKLILYRFMYSKTFHTLYILIHDELLSKCTFQHHYQSFVNMIAPVYKKEIEKELNIK